MTKTNVPDDVRMVAHHIVAQYHQLELKHDLTTAISEAIFSERLRCRDLVASMPKTVAVHHGENWGYRKSTFEDVAAKIMEKRRA